MPDAEKTLSRRMAAVLLKFGLLPAELLSRPIIDWLFTISRSNSFA